MTGVRSCRKLETACRDQIPYLWLTGWQHPDHNTLWRFYKEHRQAMRKLFERTVRTAVTMKLVDLAVQAVDGTKVSANASVYRTHNAEELRKLLNRVEAAIRDLEAQNEAGEDTAAVHLPGELANKEMLREQVRQAMALADAAYHSGKGLEGCACRGQSVAMPETRQQLLGDPYHKDRFTHDEHSDSFRCPQGQRLQFLRIQRLNGVPWRLYRASEGVCQACPAFGVCTKSKEFRP